LESVYELIKYHFSEQMFWILKREKRDNSSQYANLSGKISLANKTLRDNQKSNYITMFSPGDKTLY